MIRSHLMVLRVALLVGDWVAAAVLVMLVSLLRFGDGEAFEIWQRLGIDIGLATAVFATVWVVALWSQGLYRLRARWRLATEAKSIIRATALMAVVAMSVLWFFKQADVSRLFLVLLLVAMPLVTFTGRAVLWTAFSAIRRRGYNTQYMLIVGTGTFAEAFADGVEGRPSLGLEVIGHLSTPSEADGPVSRPILGDLQGLEAIFHSHVIDEVAVCLPAADAQWLDPVARLAADEGKTVRVPLDPGRGGLPNIQQEEFEGFLVQTIITDDQHAAALVAKRLIDIVGATIGLLVLSPLILGTALVLRLREGPPVLFHQRRVGLHGRPFTIHKFRTMVPDAEEHLEEVKHLNERAAVTFKVADDPRITPLGRTLRATSLDELPQLWNVLKGEMSLVGPRPPLADEVASYDIWHRRRLSMKPGITGLWQVEARHKPEFDQWVERDLAYIDRWSILLDFKILLRTIPAVITRTGT